MLNALLPPPDGNNYLGDVLTEALFITSLVWSVGASLLEDGRVKFDAYLKRLSGLSTNPSDGNVAAGEIPSALPTLFDYYFDVEKQQWVPWTAKVPDYKHDPEMRLVIFCFLLFTRSALFNYKVNYLAIFVRFFGGNYV